MATVVSQHLRHLGFFKNFILRKTAPEAKQKNMCVSGYMLLKIRVGRSDYFFIFFEVILFCPKYFFIKTELVYLDYICKSKQLIMVNIHALKGDQNSRSEILKIYF